MRHAKAAAKGVADGVTGSEAAARASPRHGEPHSDLALEARVQITRVCLRSQESLNQPLHARFGQGVGVGRAHGIAELLHRVVHGLHAGGEPQLRRGRESHGRIEHHSAWGKQRMAVALLGATGDIGDTGKGGELGGREGRRDGNHTNAGGQLRDIRAIRSRADAVGTETLSTLDPAPERQLHDLGRVDHRPTAHGHEQVRTKPPCLRGAGDNALTRRMGRELLRRCRRRLLQSPWPDVARGRPVRRARQCW